MGMNMDVAVEKLNICGKMQMVIQMDMNTSFPHMSSFSLSFQEKWAEFLFWHVLLKPA